MVILAECRAQLIYTIIMYTTGRQPIIYGFIRLIRLKPHLEVSIEAFLGLIGGLISHSVCNIILDKIILIEICAWNISKVNSLYYYFLPIDDVIENY